MGVVCEQMKWLVCNKLASCLRMKSSSNASAPSIIARKTSGIDLGVFQQNVQQPAAVAGNNSDQLLVIVATGTKGKAMSSVRIQQLFLIYSRKSTTQCMSSTKHQPYFSGIYRLTRNYCLAHFIFTTF